MPLLEAGGEFEARTIVAVLEDAGIEAHIFVLGNLGLPHSLTPGSTGIPVMVRQSSVEQAKAALEASKQLGASVDWDSVDVGPEPEFPPRRRRLKTVIAMGGIAILLAGGVALSAAMFGVTSSTASKIFVFTLAAAFVTAVISSALRELRQQPKPADWPMGDDGNLSRSAGRESSASGERDSVGRDSP
ncbi:MAG: hypothetical protein KF724_02800 [Phycisphaeraceae bacterium]|nr:hypothetical protein [Phycisphaeraceae bacterium]